LKVRVLLVTVSVLITLGSLAACQQSTPSSSTVQSVQANPAATAAQPTQVPTSQSAPTEAPKTSYPAGRPITFILPWPAGGGADVGGRALAAGLEKALGVPVQVVNKPGASSQVGMTEFVKAKADGYTLGYPSLPTTMNTYLNPEFKAPYTGNDFLPVAMQSIDPAVVVVRADSPYKTVKDLLDAAKAKPETLKVGTAGILSTGHITTLALERLTGAKFNFVHFDGGPTALTAMLGGHVDAVNETTGTFIAAYKSGQVHVLGVMHDAVIPVFPDVKPLDAQGYKVYLGQSRGLVVPAGTPKKIVDVLSATMKQVVLEDQAHRKRLEDMGLILRFMDAAQYAKYWTDLEGEMKPLVDLALTRK